MHRLLQVNRFVFIFLPGPGSKGMHPAHGIFCHSAHVPFAHVVVAESVNSNPMFVL